MSSRNASDGALERHEGIVRDANNTSSPDYVLPTREQVEAIASGLRDPNDNFLRYSGLAADWLEAQFKALSASPVQGGEKDGWRYVHWLVKQARDETLTPEERLSAIANFPTDAIPKRNDTASLVEALRADLEFAKVIVAGAFQGLDDPYDDNLQQGQEVAEAKALLRSAYPRLWPEAALTQTQVAHDYGPTGWLHESIENAKAIVSPTQDVEVGKVGEAVARLTKKAEQLEYTGRIQGDPMDNALAAADREFAADLRFILQALASPPVGEVRRALRSCQVQAENAHYNLAQTGAGQDVLRAFQNIAGTASDALQTLDHPNGK